MISLLLLLESLKDFLKITQICNQGIIQ